jgi:hypothetical protein
MPVQLAAFGADEMEPAGGIPRLAGVAAAKVAHSLVDRCTRVTGTDRCARLAATPVVTHLEAPDSVRVQESDANPISS